MAPKDKTYDIILFYTYFRVHNYFLNIIKYLSPSLSIGILVVEDAVKYNTKKKVSETDTCFLACCIKNGAELLDLKEKYNCKLAIAPQGNYDTKFLTDKLSIRKIIVFQRFGSGALGLDDLNKIGANKIFVYDKKMFLAIIASEKRNELASKLEIKEMGTPYKKYPAVDFSSLNIDYLIAYPTPMLIKSPQKKYQLLANINNIIDSIPNNKNVYLKLHNVVDSGYILGGNIVLKKLGGVFVSIADQVGSFFFSVVSLLNMANLIPDKLLRLFIQIKSNLIEAKTRLLSEVTPYHNFGIELFLPFVKEGVITGISSCTWHSLYCHVAVYNCDVQHLSKDMPNYAVYKNFHIPPCQGELRFDSAHFETTISNGTLGADLIEMIKSEI